MAAQFLVDQGERAYVERIEIRGNTRTRDYVIRREFDIGEGDAFNQEVITRAKRRLEALGFFSSVNITTAPGSQSDPDGWTLRSADGSMTAHSEHTVAVTDDGPRILTTLD